MQLTAVQLRILFPQLSEKKAELYAADFSQALERSQINTRARLCAFVAQLGHESQDLKFLREIWGPTKAQSRYDIREDLGNTPERDGDGKLYLGRGGLQRTGKSNYQRFKDATGIDVVKHPELLERPEYAFQSDALYWIDHKLNKLADRLTLRGDANDLDRFDKITQVINGGQNGRVERQRRYLVALATLPESFFAPSTPKPNLEESKTSSLDRVNAHVNPPPAEPPVDHTKILLEKLNSQEVTHTAAKSVGARMFRPAAVLVSALAAGNKWAWIGTVIVLLAIAWYVVKNRAHLKAKAKNLIERFGK